MITSSAARKTAAAGGSLVALTLCGGASARGGSLTPRAAPLGSLAAQYWPLRKLGIHKRFLLGRPGREVAVNGHFVLPKGARQGPKLWYLVRVHARIKVRDFRPGAHG